MRIEGKAVAHVALSNSNTRVSKELANYLLSMEGIATNLSDVAKSAKGQLHPSVEAEIADLQKIAVMKDPPAESTGTMTAAGLSGSSRSVVEDSKNDGKHGPKSTVSVDDDTISSKNSVSSDGTSKMGGSNKTGDDTMNSKAEEKAQDDCDGKPFAKNPSSTNEAQASTKPSEEVGAKPNDSVNRTSVTLEFIGANSDSTNLATGTEAANAVVPAAAGTTGTGASAMLTSNGTEQRTEQLEGLLREAARQEEQQPSLAQEDIGVEQEEEQRTGQLQGLLLAAARHEEDSASAKEDIGMEEANDVEEEEQREEEVGGAQREVEENEDLPPAEDHESIATEAHSNERDNGDDAGAHVAEEVLENGDVLRVVAVPRDISTVAIGVTAEDLAGTRMINPAAAAVETRAPALRTAALQLALVNAATATAETLAPAPAHLAAAALPNTAAATVETPAPAPRRASRIQALQVALDNAATATRADGATVTHDAINADTLPVAKRTRSMGKPKDDGEAPEFPIMGITPEMADNIDGTFYRKEGYIPTRVERQAYVPGGLMGQLCVGDGQFTVGGAGGYDYTMGLPGDLQQRGSGSKKRRRTPTVTRQTKASLRALMDNEELAKMPKKDLMTLITHEYEQSKKKRKKGDDDEDDDTAGSP